MRSRFTHSFVIRTCLLLSLILFSVSQAIAARYTLKDIEAVAPDFTLSSINNVGTIAGLNNDTPKMPFVWRIYVDPNTNETSYNISDIVLLETDNLCSLGNATDCLSANLTFSDITITAINNEQSFGTGGDIIGWYTDDNGDVQSVLWYQEKNLEENLIYKAITLPPLEETARYCKAEKGNNFLTPECIYAGLDDIIINEIKECASFNTNWETEGIRIGPGCADLPVPVCEYSMTNTTLFNQEPVGQNSTSTEVQLFNYNPDKLENRCILREHVEIALLANQCAENDNWQDNSTSETLSIAPITITCDKQSKAFAINNNKNIFGVSYSATRNIRHPVAWLRAELNADDGSPRYRVINLGLERADVTPKSVKDYNKKRAETDPEKSPSIKVNRWEGEAQIASATTGDVAGTLKFGEDASNFMPYYWPTVSNTGYSKPMELTSALKDDIGKYLSFFTPPTLPNAPNLTAISSRKIAGWYPDENNVARAIQWLLVPARDEKNAVIDVLAPSFIPMLEEDYKGKVLHANSSTETVGSSVVTSNGFTNDNAIYRSPQCGTQDLNQLLVTPMDNEQRLIKAYRIASGRAPNPIIAKGTGLQINDPDRNYVLLPTDIYVNLKIDISTNRDRLTVGDESTYYITLTNNATTYATCVYFTLEASVYEPEPDENGFLREELLAGLSFLRVESQANITCKTSPIRVTCIIDQLNPGEPISVIATTSPRALLADRRVKTSVNVYSTEIELLENQNDNYDFVITPVDRKGCFIATAAYGSYLSPEVKGLRAFRDEVLLATSAGRWLVETYYDVSPPYADYISQHENLRALSRWALSPLVYFVLYPLPMTAGILVLLYFYFGFRFRIKARGN